MALKQYGDPYNLRDLCTKSAQEGYKNKKKQNPIPQFILKIDFCCHINFNNYCFTSSKPVGLGAIDLTQLKIGDENLPTMNDFKS